VQNSRCAHNNHMATVLACAAASIFIVLILPLPALAADTPIGDIFCTLTGWASGNTGKALATIAIIIMGLYKLLGRISGRAFLVTMLGIAIIFGAGSIIDALNISNAAAGCATNASWPGR